MATATVQQLADLVGGKLVGDGAVVIEAARPLNEAAAGHITFLENDKKNREPPACKASAIILKPDQPLDGIPVIQANDPFGAFLAIYRYLHVKDEPEAPAIDARAAIHPTARLGANVSVGPFAVVGAGTVIGDRCRIHAGVVLGRSCRLGDDVILYPNVAIYDGCALGHRVIIHANSVIGADGFGYRPQNGKHVKVPQMGTVEIAADVEIGACTTIDRGTFGATRIGEGTKIDNLVMIGHNCRIGKHNIFVSQMGIAGSSSTGDYVVAAGQVGIADHVEIGDRAVLGAKAGVSKNVPAGATWIGVPAGPARDYHVQTLNIDKIPEIKQDIRRIKKHLGLE